VNWIYRGTCWKFGDNLGIDGDVMPLRFALERELDPAVLPRFPMPDEEWPPAAPVLPAE